MTYQAKIKYGSMALILAAFVSIAVLKMNAPKVYEGVAEGFDSEIKVKVTAYRNGKGEVRISDIQVEHGDTEAIAGPAIQSLVERIKSTQKVDIEGVAGATFSSTGLLEAVQVAVAQIPEK